jgi:outer membrane lipoprotein-sorting protein
VTDYLSRVKSLVAFSTPLLALACGNSPEAELGELSQSVTGATTVSLIDARNAQGLTGFDPIAEGATITLEDLPTQQLSLRANPTDGVGSVSFTIDQTPIHFESLLPYSLCGDATSSYTACPELNLTGAHTVTVKLYSGSGGTGTELASNVWHFNVQTSGSGTPEPEPEPEPEPPSGPPPTTPPPSGPVAFPLKVSSNQRYLVDSNNVPFPILGDSAWEVAHNLVPADQEAYLADRSGRGFNAVLVEAIEHKFTSKKPPMDFNSNLPFTRRLDSATYTGSPNGTTSTSGSGTIVAGPTFAADPYGNINAQAPDFTYLGSAYWTEMDAYISRAAARGMAVFMWPAYVGFGGGDEGWIKEMVANDAVIGSGGLSGQSYANNAKSRLWNYGAWLAAHYAAYGNIVWVLGGDYAAFSGAESNAVANLLAGMKSVSGQKSVLWTAHWARPSFGSDLPQFAASLDLESVYENADAASQARAGYTHSPTRPAFAIEGLYEGNPNAGGPVRRLQWASLFGAPAGQFFGSTSMWAVGSQWRSAMDTQGTREQSVLNGFVRSVAWQGLVPSGLNGQKTIAVSNGSVLGQTDYVACAGSSSLVGCYVPPAWSRGTLGVNATVLSSGFRARWLNPTTGAYTLISNSVANTGTATFTPPGNNGSGTTDWVLVLDTAGFVAGGTPNAAPSFQSSAAAGQDPVTGSSVALSSLGADDGGEAALSYTWAATGTPPAAVVFSANGNNAAKSSIASFSKPGTYSLRVTTTDAQGLTATSSLTLSVNATLTSITVAPSSVTLAPSARQTFTAAAKDQFGAALASSPTFAWTTSGGGSIDAAGVYTAGSSAGGPFSVNADSAGKRGSASVTISAAPAPQPQSFAAGESSVLGLDDSGNGNWLIAQPITLTKAASLQSLSFYVAAPSGSIVMGLYDATGPSQMPGRKLAQTAALAPTQSGWATATTSTTTLQPGKYWLAYLCSSSAMHSRRTPNGGGQSYYYQLSYSATLPATFWTGATPDPVAWSFYGTFFG